MMMMMLMMAVMTMWILMMMNRVTMMTSASQDERVGKQMGRVKSEKVTGRSSCNVEMNNIISISMNNMTIIMFTNISMNSIIMKMIIITLRITMECCSTGAATIPITLLSCLQD